MLYGSLIDRMESGLTLRPVGDLHLLRLLSEFADAPGKHADPEATMVALVRALCVCCPALALEALEDVGGKLKPKLACLGFLHLARAFNTLRNDTGTANAFARALAHLPWNELDRHMLTPAFESFFQEMPKSGFSIERVIEQQASHAQRVSHGCSRYPHEPGARPACPAGVKADAHSAHDQGG